VPRVLRAVGGRPRAAAQGGRGRAALGDARQSELAAPAQPGAVGGQRAGAGACGKEEGGGCRGLGRPWVRQGRVEGLAGLGKVKGRHQRNLALWVASVQVWVHPALGVSLGSASYIKTQLQGVLEDRVHCVWRLWALGFWG